MNEFPPKIENKNEREQLANYLHKLGKEIENGEYSSADLKYEYTYLKPDPPSELLKESILMGFKITIEVRY